MFLPFVFGCNGRKPMQTLYIGGPVEGLKRVEAPFVTLDLVDGVRVDYDELVDEIKYLQLGKEKGLIGEIAQILYHRDRYYIYDKAQDMVFIFDSATGECIRRINSKGRGPQEYLAINNIDINREADELIVVDRLKSQVLFYDLDGNYKYVRTMPVLTGATLYLRDSSFVYQVHSHQNHYIDELKGYGMLVSAGDSIIGKGFTYLPSQIGYGGDLENLRRGYDDAVYYRPLYSDSIYRINPDMTYSLAWHAKLRNSAWERNSGSKTYVVDMGTKNESRIYSRFNENKDFFIGYAASVPRRRATVDFYMYDKTKNITYIADLKQYDDLTKLDRFWGYMIAGVAGDYFILDVDFATIESVGIKDKVKNGTMQVTDSALEKIIDEADENDNPFLVLTKFKSL